MNSWRSNEHRSQGGRPLVRLGGWQNPVGVQPCYSSRSILCGIRLAASMSSWRGVSDSPIWREHDVVIMQQKRGRESYYELYMLGQDIRHYPRLLEAQQAVEHDFGPLNWDRQELSVDTYHYYFGWTTEFTDPAIVWTASFPS